MIYLDKGYIGCFEMIDRESGKYQLENYVRQLKDAGHKRIIAPINGSTWHNYRFMSWSNGTPVFPLEPQNPLWYNDIYMELGFKPLMKYRSDRFSIDNINPLVNDGSSLSIRNFCDGDLKIIYDISLQSFDRNFLYSHITFEEFKKLYDPILPMIDKELVIIAEVSGIPAGFMFSLIANDIQILKSIAILPNFRSSGVGTKLINHILLVGQRKDAKTAIAALMSEDNNSNKIVSKYNSEKIREYTLYCLEV